MINTNRISYRIGKGARSFVAGLGRGDALLPVILLESFVTGGRTYHAYKRGGFVEARERGTEETLGAIFWLGGVQAFNKIGDQIGKKLLKLKTVDFEVGKDAVRDPIKNFMKQSPIKYSEKTLATFKFTKIVSSILLANAVIGFVVPKINQAITRKYQKSLENFDKNKPSLLKDGGNLDGFINETSNKDKKDTSFQGSSVQTLLSLTNNFENDARYKLLSTDAGIAGGRALNARNEPERREILFRDLSSIYFYLFCRKNLNSLLNLAENGRADRLDSVSARKLDAHLRSNMKTKQTYTVEEFERLVFGRRNAEIPEQIKEKIKNGIISLEEFKATEKDSLIAKRAESMSRLQPKAENISILTAEQVKDVYSNGLIDSPRFLNKIFGQYTGKKSTDPFKFVSEKDLRGLKQEMTDYIEDIIKEAKSTGESITLDTLKKASRNNFIKNTFNLGVGFAVSAYFLSTAIPKIQYWMTKKQTGENKFPGIQKYKNQASS